jgi:hypothetical protein
MNFVQLFEDTWEQSRRHLLSLFIITLVLLAVSVVSFGILAPAATAGYCGSILRMVRHGREPGAADLFSELRLFFPLAFFGLGVLLLTALGMMLFLVPGILILAGVAFSCLYMIPLMVDRRMGLIDAVRESWAMARRGPVTDHLVTLLIVVGVQVLGGSLLLGTLVATPLTTVFLMNVYEHRQGHDLF